MLKDDYLTFIALWLALETISMVTPLCIAVTVLRLVSNHLVPVPAIFAHLALLETLFYLFFFLPRRYVLDQLPPAFTPRTREERRELFYKCIETIPDLNRWFSIWFKGLEVSLLLRENVKTFLAWGFFNKTRVDVEDDEELEEYLREIEMRTGRSYPSGSNQLEPCRVSTDRLCIQHKPLIYYMLTVSIADTLCHILMSNMSFTHYRLPITSAFRMFPLRPLALCSGTISPSPKLSYWYRPHMSRKHSPLLFIHGIGIGLQLYTGLLHALLAQIGRGCEDGQIGILALEIMPISFRITDTLMPREEMVDEIRNILAFHGWTDFVIVAHSFGSILATHLLRRLTRECPTQKHSLVLVDPVTLSIHFAEIPYNFIYRKPRNASELLCSFASRDIGVCPSIMRLFDWTQNVLWLEEIADRPVVVFLAGKDVIIDAEKLRQYLKKNGFMDSSSAKLEVNGRSELNKRTCDGRIVFHRDYNHGEILIRSQGNQELVDAIIQASRQNVWLDRMVKRRLL
ncbi:uncharacterized protein PV09_05921 [Verruconis gallopava]|uniref:AB hydrolase-1 domain-containing protein n=1 Tax=Verruconis gallopava TaxID=253628 RepID=A0A0D2AUP0_9PEZI|nr:uncharacterized protein PV09_05921 [Verruconis gallopava]KIW02869.1 hypothetical protein PV09_05921 [Verruconis gallopava]